MCVVAKLRAVDVRTRHQFQEGVCAASSENELFIAKMEFSVRTAHQPPENIEEGHVWKSEIRLVKNKSLGWIEARRRAETVINNCDAPIRRLPRLLHQKLGRSHFRMPKSLEDAGVNPDN